MMKKIMIVSYYFPPFKRIGSKRIYNFSRRLSQENYEVIVIKAENKNYGVDIDKNLVTKDTNIKTVSIDAKYSLFHNLFFNYHKFKKIVNEIVSREQISLIIISGGPFFYFPLGRHIYSKYSIPYILDYRDNYFSKPGNIREMLFLWIFKYCWDKPSLKDSSYIVNVTKSLTNLHKMENREINKDKFITIFNGYDNLPTVSSNKTKQKKDKKVLKVGIFGKFYYYNPNDVDVLLKSFDNKDFEIIIYQIGEIEEGFLDKILKYQKEASFKFLGYKNYKEGMKILQDMDCLMLNNRQPYALGTKIFDYIFLNKPIIAFTEKNSEIENLLKMFKNTYCIYKERENIKEIFTEIFSKEEKFLDKNIKNIEKYSRDYQFKKLLDKIKPIIL